VSLVLKNVSALQLPALNNVVELLLLALNNGLAFVQPE
tara:strand:- start:571 stop:684 length:114 start_codon:yes stop_codon:yes gene_type:complete